MGNPAGFASIAMLEQHMFNLAWIGLVVTVGCVYVWRRSPRAIFFNALIGGSADLGYFLFVDLAGYAEPPGPQMTCICALAIVLSFVAYFKPGADASTSPATG